jgi:polar amino acid transport system substrate-binding protein
MKKRTITAMLLAMALVVMSLAACGKTSDSTAESTDTSTDAATTVSDDDGVFTVAMDLKYPPFTGTDDDGNPEGLEVDIANALGEYLGQEVKIIDVDFSMLIPSLESGEADAVICEMTVNDERKEKVDFSHPYLYDHTLALVNKDYADSHGITDDMSEEDFFALDDANYVGLAGTIAVSIPQDKGKDVEELTEIAAVLTQVDKGLSDIFIGANSILGCHAAYPETTIVYSGISNYTECAVAVKKGNSELLDQINEFIDSMYEDGGFYVEAGDKYDEAIGDYLQDSTKGLDYIIYPPTTE